MSNINTGGPAFPLQSIGPDFAPGYAGMTLRDYFAASALTGLLAHHASDTHSDEQLATQAYHLADAMLKEREKTQ